MAAAPQPLAKALRITPAETNELLTRGRAIAVDVRSPEHYANGHIPGAILTPINRLRTLLANLPRDKTIVFY